jgi:Tfp pilus assembly PilM family ATPase
MDIDGLALLNCFNACERREAGRPTSVLNVGGTYTNLAIIGNNNWPFIRDVAYAGNDIIEEIATEKTMSAESVRKALFGDSAEAQSKIHDSLEKACWKLTADVTKTLRYYTAQEKTTLAEKIYVCGGFALAKGFVEILNSQLPAEAVLWNPFDKIRCDTGYDSRGILQKNVLQKSGPALAVAAGLAMRSI